MSTIVAAPTVIAIEGAALFTGLLSIIGKYSVKWSTSKAEKHEKIKTIASTKLNTISSHISKTLTDNEITDDEFRLILEELEKYKVMKEEVRTKTKRKIMAETEESLIERGWLRKTMADLCCIKTPKYNFSFSCVITND